MAQLPGGVPVITSPGLRPTKYLSPPTGEAGLEYLTCITESNHSFPLPPPDPLNSTQLELLMILVLA